MLCWSFRPYLSAAVHGLQVDPRHRADTNFEETHFIGLSDLPARSLQRYLGARFVKATSRQGHDADTISVTTTKSLISRYISKERCPLNSAVSSAQRCSTC